MTTSSDTTRQLRQPLALLAVVMTLVASLALAPSAQAQQAPELATQFRIVTKACADRYHATYDEDGARICYEANPYADGIDGDQGAFGCSLSVDGRPVLRDVDPGYSIDEFPYIEVLFGCYYYPGITIERVYSPPVWTLPTYDYSSFTLSL